MKDCILIIPKGATTYDNIFPLIKEERAWIGLTSPRQFNTATGETTNMQGLTKWFGNIGWINIIGVHPKDTLVLTKSYYADPSKYPTYDNYPAINVDKLKEIPYDYEGEMGVPVTFLEGYHPDFQLIKVGADEMPKDLFNEYLSQGNTAHYGHSLLAYRQPDGKIKVPYNRVIVKKKDYTIKGLLNGEYTKIDEYTLGHQPKINGKDKYARLIIQRKGGNQKQGHLENQP